MTQPAPLDGPHWSFSLAVYGEPGIAPACLALQNEFGVDVNILLLVAWAAANGNDVGVEDIARLDGEVGRWRGEVILPLRGMRTMLKTATYPLTDQTQALALRKRVQEIELVAEQIEQAAIAGWLADHRLAASNDSDAAGRVRQALLRVVDHFRSRTESEPLREPDRRLEPIVSAVCRHRMAPETPKGN